MGVGRAPFLEVIIYHMCDVTCSVFSTIQWLVGSHNFGISTVIISMLSLHEASSRSRPFNGKVTMVGFFSTKKLLFPWQNQLNKEVVYHPQRSLPRVWCFGVTVWQKSHPSKGLKRFTTQITYGGSRRKLYLCSCGKIPLLWAR